MSKGRDPGISRLHEASGRGVRGIMFEQGTGTDRAKAGAVLAVREHCRLKVHWTIRKYRNEFEYRSKMAPYEILEYDHNVQLQAGITNLLNIAVGIAATAWNSTAYLAVGTSTVAASASQSGMQATGTASASAQLTGAPTVSAQTATFVASFASNVANFAWNEIGLANSANTFWDRLQTTMGTKASPAVWTATLTISLS